jgi:PAS domain S-box-containing protein
MYTERPSSVLLFCILVTVATGVLQYVNPELRIFDGGLITAILLTVFLKEEKYTKIFGAVSVVLIIASSFYAARTEFSFLLLLPYLFSALIAALTTIAVLYIKKLYHSIDHEKQQVNALFHYATQGIILTNGKGEIVLANPQVEKMFGYEGGELLGKPVELLLPTRVHTRHVQYREDYYHHPVNRPMGHGRDLFAVRKNGDEFPVEVSLSYYEQKGQYFVIAFVVDITQRKVAEKNLVEQHAELERVTADVRKLNTELETKVEERTTVLKEALERLEKSQQELSQALNKEKELGEIKSRFVSMASHEFRTPLSTVLSSAGLIQNYIREDEQDKRQRHVKRIKDSVKHLNDLLEDFLSLGRLEEGRVRTEFEQMCIKEFMDDIVDEIKPILKPGQWIECGHSGASEIISDKRLLKNIMINLLGNAVKFSAEGSVIKIQSHNDGSEVQIAVQDHGIGIPQDEQSHLFSSFYRAKNAVNIQGTGLGLHIVMRYVELLRGKIKLQSEVDVGTTIVVTLLQDVHNGTAES